MAATNWRLTPDNSALIVIDVQERLMSAMPRRVEILANINRLLAAMKILQVPTLMTLQYVKGLGPLCGELAEATRDIPTMEKLCFSCCGSTEFSAAFARLNRQRAILCGVEGHVCIQQTALDLLAAGQAVYIPADAVCSRRESDSAIAIDRMRSAGAVISTVESLVFELLREAGTAQFKSVLPLFK